MLGEKIKRKMLAMMRGKREKKIEKRRETQTRKYEGLCMGEIQRGKIECQRIRDGAANLSTRKTKILMRSRMMECDSK